MFNAIKPINKENKTNESLQKFLKNESSQKCKNGKYNFIFNLIKNVFSVSSELGLQRMIPYVFVEFPIGTCLNR